ncbi:MAG: 2-isopropylmalate synthase [Candidatus Hodarchaeota archaeon]
MAFLSVGKDVFSIDEEVVKRLKDVRIFDTTLRDGEQTPGCILTPPQKVKIARALDEFGVHVIEAGMAITSLGEREGIKAVVKEGLNAEICSGCRSVIVDIERSLECGVDSIHLIVASSELHRREKFGKTLEEILDITTNCIDFAKDHGLIVELSAEDGSRADMDDLIALFTTGKEAKADRFCVCDTVGVAVPEQIYARFKILTETFPNIPISIHCHNDFGLAVANTLAALKGGGKQFHGTINGVGERAGNVAIEEVVMSLKALYGVELPVKTEKIFEVSRVVSDNMNLPVAFNKALVGENAFAHESGIHSSAVLKNPETYEPIPPNMIGRRRRLVMGKHAGRAALKEVLEEFGFHVNDDQLIEIFDKMKKLADLGKKVTDSDLVAITETVTQGTIEEAVKLNELTVVTGNKITSTASVKIATNRKEIFSSGFGTGPVDAAMKAIESALKNTEIPQIHLEDYHVDAITGGTEAVVNVRVTLRKGDNIITASGASGDIVMASVEAMLTGYNKLLALEKRKNIKK